MNEAPAPTADTRLARIEQLVESSPLVGGRLPVRHGVVGSVLRRILYRGLRVVLIQDHEWRVAVRDAFVAQEAALAAQAVTLAAAVDELAALREHMDRNDETARNEVAVLAQRVQWLGEKAQQLDGQNSREPDEVALG